MPAVWAIADLHLSISTPEKDMSVFGPRWENCIARTKNNWIQTVAPEDLVLIPGDISWAHNLDQALIDLQWIDTLPGTKVMIKGNHDYWWQTISKLRKLAPPSIHFIQNDTFDFMSISIAGTKLYDTNEFNYSEWVIFKQTEGISIQYKPDNPEHIEKIYQRELLRLEQSLQKLNPKAQTRIVMTHYPPIGPNLSKSLAKDLLDEYNINHVCYGHIHSMKDHHPFSHRYIDGTHYHFVAADDLHFFPRKICEIP